MHEIKSGIIAQSFEVIFAKEIATNRGISGKIKHFAAQYINQTFYFFCFCIAVDFAQNLWFTLGSQMN